MFFIYILIKLKIQRLTDKREGGGVTPPPFIHILTRRNQEAAPSFSSSQDSWLHADQTKGVETITLVENQIKKRPGRKNRSAKKSKAAYSKIRNKNNQENKTYFMHICKSHRRDSGFCLHNIGFMLRMIWKIWTNSVGLSVCYKFLKGREDSLHAPIGALVFFGVCRILA